MKDRFEKLEAGFYVLDTENRVIIIERKSNKWECDLIRKSDSKKERYTFNSLKQALEFVEFWYDDFNDLFI